MWHGIILIFLSLWLQILAYELLFGATPFAADSLDGTYNLITEGIVRY